MNPTALPVLLLAIASLPLAAAVAEPSGLTAALRAPDDEQAAFMLRAEGVHVFECKASVPGPTGFGWQFVAPDATLYEGSRSIGSHKTANLWESTSDRSSVSGTLRATQAAGADNIPWALFRARPLAPTGLFAGVTSIQRVNTSGGAAPAEGCTASGVGREARVPFAADFYFYKRRGAA